MFKWSSSWDASKLECSFSTVKKKKNGCEDQEIWWEELYDAILVNEFTDQVVVDNRETLYETKSNVSRHGLYSGLCDFSKNILYFLSGFFWHLDKSDWKVVFFLTLSFM